MEPLKIITALRESDKYIEVIYMNGGCYQFHLFLKSIFTYAQPYIKESHVITRIGGWYFDIKGYVPNYDHYRRLEESDMALVESWSFAEHNTLKLTECSNCEEPFTV